MQLVNQKTQLEIANRSTHSPWCLNKIPAVESASFKSYPCRCRVSGEQNSYGLGIRAGGGGRRDRSALPESSGRGIKRVRTFTEPQRKAQAKWMKEYWAAKKKKSRSPPCTRVRFFEAIHDHQGVWWCQGDLSIGMPRARLPQGQDRFAPFSECLTIHSAT